MRRGRLNNIMNSMGYISQIRHRFIKEKMVNEGSLSTSLRLDSPSHKTLQETLDGGFSNPLEQCQWERMGQKII